MSLIDPTSAGLHLRTRICIVQTEGDEENLTLIFCRRSKVIINKVLEAKLKEIEIGVDGFMVYDVRLVPYINEVGLLR